jgi:site-specific DNA-cytosine methylase
MTERHENGESGVISLFSGYGGLEMGASLALGPLRTLVTSDIEPGPTAIERFRAGDEDIPNLGDIAAVDMGSLPDADVLVGGSPCFPAGALVLTEHGFRPIETVAVGERVLTHKGNWKPVLRVGGHEGASTVILKGQGSAGIECTPNHKFWAGHKETPAWDNEHRVYPPRVFVEDRWTHAEDMAGHMWLNMGSKVPELPIPAFDFEGCQTKDIRLSTAFFYFVGRWLGDGWLNVFKRTGRKASYMKRVFICDSFDKEDELRDCLDATGLHFGASRERTSVRFCCSSTALYDWLDANFGQGAMNKHLPAWAFGMKQEWRQALLDGYTDSDGCPMPAGFHATSISRLLVLGIKALAAGLGLPGSISTVTINRPCAVIEGRKVHEHPQWSVSWYTKPRKSVVCDLGFWGHVRKILPGRENVAVYNLEVADDHSYTVDGIAVANCQNLSTAGLRAGMHEGTRSGLWSYQADAIRAKRPSLAVWENVLAATSASASSREDIAMADSRAALLGEHGLCFCEHPAPELPEGFAPPKDRGEAADALATAIRDWAKTSGIDVGNLTCTACGLPLYERGKHGLKADGERLDARFTQPTIRALGRVLGDLANLGYDAVWRGIEAADIGAPHHRARLFVTAWPRDPSSCRTPANPRLARLSHGAVSHSGAPWAEWNSARDVWELGQDDLFGEASVFMDTWPKHGIMANGAVWRVPEAWLDVPAVPLGSALATPRASDGEKGGPNQRFGSGSASLNAQANDLMYTPKASDGVLDSPATSGRPVEGATYLSTQAMLLDLPGAMSAAERERRNARQSAKREAMLSTPTAADARRDAPSVTAAEHHAARTLAVDLGEAL